LSARASVEKDPVMRNWLSEIEGYYRVAGSQPLWVNEDGFTENGLALSDEISKAYTYGLDNAQFPIPDTSTATLGDFELAGAEASLSAAAVKYIWHARGGRVDPSKLSLWLDQKPRTFYAAEMMQALAATKDSAAVLRSFHPHYPQFEALRQAYMKERGFTAPTVLAPIASGPKVALGQRHPDVIAVRERLGYLAKDPEYEDVLDRRLMGAVREIMYEAGYERKNAIDDDVRREVSKIDRSRPGTNKALIDKMLVNLERWRWMPEQMGNLHVWNNLPEFYTRVVKDGIVIHQEKIVVGTPSTQTPIFSDSMNQVIFQPDWGVPESIKIRQLLPRLKGGDYSVLERRNMKIVGNNGKPLRSPRFNWSKVNIKDVSIVQGSGSDNPLGRLKFLFPNDHDVYMHDTPSKDLFETTVRTHSHGCIRVKNPQQFAEVILGEVEGWTKADVKAQLAKPATYKVYLKNQVPVHNTYFTVTADASGKVTSLSDMYGHDRRVLDALNGRSIVSIAAADPALAQLRQNKLLEQSAAVIPRAKARPAAARAPARIAVAKAPSLFGNYGYKPGPSYLKKSPGAPKPLFYLFQYQ
jgi:L,D-transpeptidase YcbB